MLGQLFSQLLGAGAAKSRADYNKQQKINQLLKEGWVKKGEGSPEEAAAEVEEDPGASPPELLSREGAEAIYNTGDPEMAAIINEMLGVIEGEEYSGPTKKGRFANEGTPQEEVENVFPFLKGTDDDRSLDTLFGIEPLSEIDRARRTLEDRKWNRDRGVFGWGGDEVIKAEEALRQLETPGLDPNLPDEFGRDTPSFAEGKDIDIAGSDIPPAEQQGETLEGFLDYINGFAAAKEDLEDNVNPDRRSRNFVKGAFKDVRQGIDGLSPTGEEAGHWIKPIAEQLNAMFGKSTPLDMDGYEMGPYHAQRIEDRKMLDEQSRHEDRMKMQQQQHEALKEHYERMDQTDRDRLILESQHKFAKLEIDTERAKGLTSKINGGHIPSQDEMAYLESEVEKMIDWLVQEIDDTELAEYVGGYGYSWIWSEGGLDDLMPTLNLMLGLTEEGEEITPDNEPMWGYGPDFTADPDIRRGIQERIDFIREYQALRIKRPNLFSQAMFGRDQSLVGIEKDKRKRAVQERIAKLVGSILEKHQGSSTVEGDALSTRVGER